MTNPIRISIDMETVSTERNAAILTLGACVVGESSEQFYMRASLASNEHHKRDINRETMLWWDKQDPSTRLEAFGGTDSLLDVLDNFTLWAYRISTDLSDVELWSRGAGFDCEILQDAYMSCFGSYPFNFRKHMCQRTLQALMPVWLTGAVAPNLSKHNALADAFYQAQIIQAGLNNLSWGS